MADQEQEEEEEDLRMALRMSMQQHSLPEPKRSKPMDVPIRALTDSTEESMEVKTRRMQRELMAAAAEKRMLASKSATSTGSALKVEHKDRELSVEGVNLGRELSEKEANQLFSMVFGSEVSRDILAQWSNQGIRFSPDPETSMGLVQHEGGPCGVLAAVQAYVIKYLLFLPEELKNVVPTPNIQKSYGIERLPKGKGAATNDFASLTEDAKTRALVRSMGEILFLCGNNEKGVVATLSVIDHACEGSENSTKEEIISKALGGLSVDSAAALQKVLRVNTYKSQAIAFRRIQELIPIFQSRMGALLFLISALLSRGLDMVQGDRDDPSLPLVTAPFGHASQEIVNLLLCGQAVPNVFDGRMDLGGGMCLRGISTSVKVGFLTLLESLNFCKVGQHLKCPEWPIWVVGSESHYTVLFALDSTVQDENELEERESQIRKAFDAQDQSGGGGFISIEGFHKVLKETAIKLPSEKFDHLCSTGFIVWSEFWQVILELDKSLGGLKDSTGLMGKKVFDLYHFNGIAKSDLNGSQSTIGGDSPIQRPRLTILKVSVPPRWTPEEFMADVAASSASGGNASTEKNIEIAKPEPPQHAPLVDCIRTRWPRAVCNWAGHPPSIV